MKATPQVNLLAPGNCGLSFKVVICGNVFQYMFAITSCEIALRKILLNTFETKSTAVHVMAWCCQATSYYLRHCLPRPMATFGSWWYIVNTYLVLMLICCSYCTITIVTFGREMCHRKYLVWEENATREYFRTAVVVETFQVPGEIPCLEWTRGVEMSKRGHMAYIKMRNSVLLRSSKITNDIF